jgi:transglutaminase-like putative cysteine protease
MILQKAVIFAIASLAVLLLSCGGATSWLNDDELRACISKSGGDAHGQSDAGAVVLLDEGSMEINSGGEVGLSVFEKHSIVRILNPRGQKYANIVIPYSSNSVVDEIQARTLATGGRIVPLQAADIFDVSLYPNFVFFSDQRAKIFTMPSIDDGSVVEYCYRLTIRGKTFWHSWTFQDDVPVLLSRFTLVKPGEWDVIYKSYGIPVVPSVTKAPPPFRSKHVWEARDIPPLRSEFGMPPDHEVTTRLAIAPVGFTSWDDVAHWYNEVIGNRNAGGTAVQAMAESLTRNAQSDIDRLRILYEWVRDQIRYLAVEIGTGGFEPHSADEVFAKRYGDCKDLVMLLSALARTVHIDVRPVLISTWHNGRADTSLPSALQFNHLIGYAPDVRAGGIWLDATDKAGVFGRLPWYDQGVPVVVAGPAEKGYRAFTPAESADANGDVLDWDVELNADGTALVTGKTILTGAYALELRNDLRLADSTAVRQWLNTSIAHRCPGATVLNYTLPPERPVRDTLTVSYRFHAPSFAVRRDSLLAIRPWTFTPLSLADFFRAQERTQPIRFRHPSQTEIRLAVWAPLGWQFRAAASADSSVASCGLARWQEKIQPRSASLRMMVQLQGDDLMPAQYQAFRNFLDGVRLREVRELMLSRQRDGD